MADGYHTGNVLHYNRAIRMEIGAALRAMYDSEPPEPLPHRLFSLLIDLNGQPGVKDGDSDTSSGSNGAE